MNMFSLIQNSTNQTNNSNPDIIEVGKSALDFSLTDETGSVWKLSEQKGKVSVLLFYPQNETLVCTKQLCSVRDHWHDYLATKAAIVGISSGTNDENSLFTGKYKFPIRLLSDNNRQITGLYGRHHFLPLNWTRAIVLVDAKGIIRFRKIMLRAFRPTDRSLLAQIYAARADAIYAQYETLKTSFWKRKKTSE